MKPWPQHLRDTLNAIIKVPFYIVITQHATPMRANVLISIRRPDDLDDEIVYWQEELRELPLMTITYSPQRSMRTKYIRFMCYETQHAHPILNPADRAIRI